MSQKCYAQIPHPFAIPIAGKIVDGSDGFIQYEWNGHLGCEDVLEESTDLKTWVPAFGPVYGIGQTFSVNIAKRNNSVPAGGATTIQANPKPYYPFMVVVFPNQLYVKLGTSSTSVSAIPANAWSSLTYWNTSLGAYDVDAKDAIPAYGVLIFKRNSFPGETPPATSPLSPANQELLVRFDGAFEKVKRNSSGQFPRTQYATLPMQSVKRFFRLRRTTLDSDNDYIYDYQELEWNKSSPYNWDSDGDQVSDMEEDWDEDTSTTAEEIAFKSSPVRVDRAAGGIANYPSHWDPSMSWEDVIVGGVKQYTLLRAMMRPGIAYGFRYQLEFRLAGTNTWTPIDTKAHDLGAYSPYNPPPTDMEYHIFKAPFDQPSESTAAIPATATSPAIPAYKRQFLRLRVLPPGMPRSLEIATVTAATFKAHNNACFSALMPQDSWAARDVFERTAEPWPDNSTFDKKLNCQWHKYSCMQRLNLTGVAWDSDAGFHLYENIGVPPIVSSSARHLSQAEINMISPRHGLMATHMYHDYFRYPVLSPQGYTPNQLKRNEAISGVVFYDRSGNKVERKIKQIRDIWWPTRSGEVIIKTTHDVSLVTLDEDLPPSIAFYPLLPTRNSSGTLIDWSILLQEAKCLTFSREREGGFYKLGEWDIDTFQSNPRKKPKFKTALDTTVPLNLRWPRDYAIDGDSSGPCFVLYRGKPVLIGHNTFAEWELRQNNTVRLAPVEGPWYSYHGYFDQINRWMAEDGGGYQITTITFN